MLQEQEYDSDTSDEDFVPEGAAESDDEPISGVEDENEDSGDDGENKQNKKSKKKGSRKKKGNAKKLNPLLAQLGEEDNKDNSIENRPKLEDKEEEKEKANSLWADFLNDVEEKPVPPPKPKASSWGALLGKKSTSAVQSCNTKQFDAFKKDVKKDKAEIPTPSTVKITQVFEFAGEEVRVEKEVDANSKEAKLADLKSQGLGSDSISSKSSSPSIGGNKRPAGLSSIMGLIDSKKQKLSVLDKTKLDWNSYKSSVGIEEELESYKKSKDGYLEKQDFLERADLRQFEIEKNMRLGKRSNR